MPAIQRIVLVTDFGGNGPYVGQVRLRLGELAPTMPVIDLISDLTPFRPDLAAYLLPALVQDMPRGCLYICVVDPGVGGEREALILEADGNLFVGPDNGLLAILAQQLPGARVWRVGWRPERLSASFHGRDLFAPIAARLVIGNLPDAVEMDPGGMDGAGWPEDLARLIYRDGYGNLMSGLRASRVAPEVEVVAARHRLVHARTFCEVPPGRPFWYENSLGLVELAVNQGRADSVLGLEPGDPIEV